VAPFWPQGTGANLAILGAFDSAFALENFAPLIANNASDDQFGAMLSQQLKVRSCLERSNVCHAFPSGLEFMGCIYGHVHIKSVEKTASDI
jgi:hypothetical protein